MTRFICICLIVIISKHSSSTFAQDSLRGISLNEFLSIVEENHPLMLQANFRTELADAERLKAKGNFDPKIFSDLSGKQYDGKDYYFLSNSGLKIPTWFGIEVKGGYEYNDGDFLSRSLTVPGSGLWYFGATVPLGKNLFIDERRTMLRQSALMQEYSLIERKLLLNDLTFSSVQAYWEWYTAYQKYKIAERGVEFALQRKLAVVEGARVEEYAIIDTVEAHIQYLTRLTDFQNAWIDYQQTKAQISTFLWLKNQIPLELDSLTIPIYEPATLKITNYELSDSSVFLKTYAYKLDMLKLDERLAKEMLKPQVDVTLLPLVQPTEPNTFRTYDVDNFKWGVTASFPIFLRKERGEIAKINIKQQTAELDLALKRNELANKLSVLKLSIDTYNQQILIQEDLIRSNERLLEAEYLKYSIGESSLFLVNSREVKYLEALVKMADVQSKLEITKAKISWTLMVN